MEFNWNLVSKYRNEMFGLSIIGIIVFHFCESTVNSELTTISSFQKLFTMGYIALIGSTGVEIFIFLSSMGLYFSLKNNNNLERFYRRRFTRVLIPYIIWGGLFWIIADFILTKKGLIEFFYDFSLLSFWFDGNRVFWFVAFILIIYFIFPFVFSVLNADRRKQKVYIGIILILIFIALGLLKMYLPAFYQHTEIGLTRFVIFILGLYFAPKIYNKELFGLMDKLLVLFGFIVKFLALLFMILHNNVLSSLFNGRIGNCFYSISLIFTLVCLFERFHIGRLNTFLVKVGSISFELYLTHVILRDAMAKFGLYPEKIQFYIICIILAVVASIILSKVSGWISSIINKQASEIRTGI